MAKEAIQAKLDLEKLSFSKIERVEDRLMSSHYLEDIFLNIPIIFIYFFHNIIIYLIIEAINICLTITTDVALPSKVLPSIKK